MIANLQPYPEYKESGLPWLRQMPAHWGIKRGKSVFQSIDQRSATGKEELLTVSSARGVVPAVRNLPRRGRQHKLER